MSNALKPAQKLGTPANSGRNTWVQTERVAHEQWAHLTAKSPRASVLMHHLVACMGHQNAVVASQKTLAKLMGCTTRTVQNALNDLVKDRWIQVVQIGSSGTVNAYVVNSNVAWGESRDQICRLSVFHAIVIADAADQPKGHLGRGDLRILPVIHQTDTVMLNNDRDPGAQISPPTLEQLILELPPREPHFIDDMFQSTHRHISAPPRPQLPVMNDWVTAAGLDIAKLGKVRQEKLWHALTSSLRGRFRVKIRSNNPSNTGFHSGLNAGGDIQLAH